MNRIHPLHELPGPLAGRHLHGPLDAGDAAITCHQIIGMTTTTITVVRPVVPV